jgi:hypothetical protein
MRTIIQVVNIHRSPCEVYIGRPWHGLDGYFANQFETSHPSLGLVALREMFRKLFLERIQSDTTYRVRVMALRDRAVRGPGGAHLLRLGCVHAPRPCHGDVIAEFLNAAGTSLSLTVTEAPARRAVGK